MKTFKTDDELGNHLEKVIADQLKYNGNLTELAASEMYDNMNKELQDNGLSQLIVVDYLNKPERIIHGKDLQYVIDNKHCAIINRYFKL
jgi:hypothetical protein